MKTNIIVNANGINCRVKLDANKFPYIILENEKIILKSSIFPRKGITNCGLMEVSLDIVSGKEELEQLLLNPELTSDKMGLKQSFRLL